VVIREPERPLQKTANIMKVKVRAGGENYTLRQFQRKLMEAKYGKDEGKPKSDKKSRLQS
jgi:hypothetical protein